MGFASDLGKLPLAMGLSYLPARWRKRLNLLDVGDLRSAALISGIVQFVGLVILIIARYSLFVKAHMAVEGMERAQLGAMEKGGETAVMGFGVFLLLAYLVNPITLILEYFCLEGFVRALAALVTGEVVPTLPLVGVAWAQGRTQAAAAEKALGPRVVDLVQPGDGTVYHLLIASCRPKEGWDRLMTVAYQDRLYEVTHHEQGGPPRRFLYHLKRKPEGKVVRGMYQYDPAEVLREASEEEKVERASLKEKASRALQGKEAPVADLAEPGDGTAFDLRIASCREKLWDRLITVSYGDRLYEVAEERMEEGTRPFVYLLRFQPANKIVRRIHQYDPQEALRQP